MYVIETTLQEQFFGIQIQTPGIEKYCGGYQSTHLAVMGLCAHDDIDKKGAVQAQASHSEESGNERMTKGSQDGGHRIGCYPRLPFPEVTAPLVLTFPHLSVCMSDLNFGHVESTVCYYNPPSLSAESLPRSVT
jgi:hypothetical protein